MRARGWRRRLAVAAVALAAGVLAQIGATHAAIGPEDLLPVDDAFALEVRATARDRIALDWTIADGYYLYRHRTGAEAPGFPADGLRLPDGKRHVDEFFGEVETYRGRLQAELPGTAPAGDRVTLRVRFQGCADLGICYPPQTREIEVVLPSARDGLAALGRRLTGGAATGGGLVDGLGDRNRPLPPERAFGFEAIADGGDRLLLRFSPAPGYYLYRDNTRLQIAGDAFAAGTPDWPAGQDHDDEYFGRSVVFFEPIDVPVPLLRTHGEAATLTLSASFQGCQTDGICYPPMTRTVEIAVPAGTPPSVQDAAAARVAAETAPAPLPEPNAESPPPLSADGGEMGPASLSPSVAAGGGISSGGDDADPISDASADNAGRSLPPGAREGSLIGALLLALIGGLLLNLMPCVLPILSLKVVGLAASGGDRTSARRHALWYTTGVLVAFAAIGLLAVGLRATGQALGWGFQLQQPWFVAALAYLVFAVGLALSGVYTLGGAIGGGLARSLGTRTGPAGDFFTGVLACVVASPCIAPFMGGALAFAFASSAPAALGVFLALGLGLALPFLLIGFVPALADRLPRPGPWMDTLKQVMAFPMYLTAVWLVWVLGRQRGVDAMALVTAGLAVLALALWWFERGRWRGGRLGPALAAVLALAALWPVIGVERLPPPAAGAAPAAGTVAYSADTLAQLRADGSPVFVNMTADWCVTCKANERRVLAGARFREALDAAGATYMVGDWTHTDPEITAFLEAHRAVGVPLYVVFPPGDGPGEVLPTLLTDAVVTDALGRAAP
ncbi:protein-disulfide reductase DsbD family protein [Luteimonas abyssi]|uniref:protein-disulfide reductase DsbD family protein n=1 Tax=Luteimonas abyssi TaxID=1247514 RepID=UPI000737CE97|nr:protein-disulfide reductase DsbD [Luteimonas abyssi]